MVFGIFISLFEITTECDSGTFFLYYHNKFTDKKDLIKRLEFCSLKQICTSVLYMCGKLNKSSYELSFLQFNEYKYCDKDQYQCKR